MKIQYVALASERISFQADASGKMVQKLIRYKILHCSILYLINFCGMYISTECTSKPTCSITASGFTIYYLPVYFSRASDGHTRSLIKVSSTTVVPEPEGRT